LRHKGYPLESATARWNPLARAREGTFWRRSTESCIAMNTAVVLKVEGARPLNFPIPANVHAETVVSVRH
jgi:hypothetical protein